MDANRQVQPRDALLKQLRRLLGNEAVTVSYQRDDTFRGGGDRAAQGGAVDGGEVRPLPLPGRQRDLSSIDIRLRGFMRVRHFGFLANRCRARCLALIRTALAAPAPEPTDAPAVTAPFDGYPCPRSRTGRLHVTLHWVRGGVVRG